MMKPIDFDRDRIGIGHRQLFVVLQAFGFFQKTLAEGCKKKNVCYILAKHYFGAVNRLLSMANDLHLSNGHERPMKRRSDPK
jgi:hypothetical protein